MSVRALLSLATALLLGACATIERDGLRQAILVRTEPPGAGILVDGVEVAHAPAYVSIRRSLSPSFQLRTANGVTNIQLNSHYRWRGSFWPNFICYIFAPGCWVTDLVSGAAYEAVEPGTITVRLAKGDGHNARKRTPVVAVAPPLSDKVELSDAGGSALSEVLAREDLDAKVLSYKQTLPVFSRYKFDFDNSPGEKYPGRAKLYHELGLTSVVESVIEARDDELVLKATEKNVFTGQTQHEFELTLAAPDAIENTFINERWWSRLLPNTVGIDFASSGLRFTRGNETYEMQPSGDDAWWAKGVRYLSTLDVFNLPPRRVERASRWSFDFVPGLRLLRLRGRITGLADQSGNSDQEFTRWLVSTGYGGELSWQSGNNYLYFNLIPSLYWSEISWSSDQADHSYTGTGLTLQAETGYAYYFSSNWVARLFSRTQSEDSSGWTEVLGNRLPPGQGTLSISNFHTGITIAYRLGPKLSSNHWRRRQKMIAGQ